MKLTIPPREADKSKRNDGYKCEQGDEKKPFAPDFPQHERHKRNRNHQFRKASKMIPVHVRTKGQSAIAHLAKPIQFPVERQVLQDAKNGDEKSQSHQEPYQPSPVTRLQVGLGHQVNQDQVGDQELQLYARVIG